MASTSAALNRAMVAVVCVVLLHSSMGQQPTPASHTHCSPHTGQQPPTPAPAPAPTMPPPPPIPTPTPSPAPTPPAVDCHNLCTSNCEYSCSAYRDAGISKCEADAVTDFNGCYASCTSQRCPGKSCEHSDCSFHNCTACDNPNASYCCQGCVSAVSSAYSSCRLGYQNYVYYCMLSCTSDCYKKCP